MDLVRMMHYNSQSQSSGTESFEHHEQGSKITYQGDLFRGSEELLIMVQETKGETGRQSDRQTGK